jgi:hypothetical protein
MAKPMQDTEEQEELAASAMTAALVAASMSRALLPVLQGPIDPPITAAPAGLRAMAIAAARPESDLAALPPLPGWHRRVQEVGVVGKASVVPVRRITEPTAEMAM